jgi:hypothetical protein
MFKTSVFAAIAALATTFGASAATVSDLAQRDDIVPSTTYSLDLGQVDETGAASVSALLALWNSNGSTLNIPDPLMTVDFSVNSTFVTTIGLTRTSGFSDSLGENITGLLVDGSNNFTFAVNTDFTEGNPATFAVKDFSVTFTEGTAMSPVPLPASFPLFLAALGGFGLVARRRKTS